MWARWFRCRHRPAPLLKTFSMDIYTAMHTTISTHDRRDSIQADWARFPKRAAGDKPTFGLQGGNNGVGSLYIASCGGTPFKAVLHAYSEILELPREQRTLPKQGRVTR